jgi:thiol-disulfide isomerase/thioredoxin
VPEIAEWLPKQPVRAIGLARLKPGPFAVYQETAAENLEGSKKMRLFWLLFVFLVFPLAAVAAESGPRISIQNLEALPKPLPFPYDENADAAARLAKAFASAEKSGKRVLIDFGGNWCADCRILAAVMDLPEVKSYVAKHYEVVTVDVGRFNRNMALVERFGIAKLHGVPTVVIAEADGTPLNITNSADLADARSMNPQSIADWLARWTKAQY